MSVPQRSNEAVIGSSEKGWCSEFLRLRPLKGGTLVKFKEKLDANVDDDHGNFFVLSERTKCPLEVEVLGEFCRGTSFKDVREGKGTAGTQKNIWIDERTCLALEGSGEARLHSNPLTATGLLRALKEGQYNCKDMPDAARRLIYVTDLTPACVRALAETVSVFQGRVLRNAIFQYLQSQTSIAVKIPSARFLTFRLDLHLSFFILMPENGEEKSVEMEPKTAKRGWIDLSFLKSDELFSQPQQSAATWGIKEAQISCVVAGSDEWRWTGYGFVDAEVDGFLDDPLSKDEDMLQDQIAAEELEANFPLWRPREYWMRVFEIRIDYVENQWHNLIHNLELVINQYVRTEFITPFLKCPFMQLADIRNR
jgi:hypothetical protein